MHPLASPPVIPPLQDASPRPFWSVMIPCYNTGDYLADTLRSVLAQDPGPDEMQIDVVDDGPPENKAQTIARDIGHARVGFYRNESNLGLSGNWNECLRRARGQVVHLLHQDDVIAPGFYQHLRTGLNQEPEAGAAFCRYGFVDEKGERTWQAPPERETPGLLDGWLEQIAVKCRIQCVSVVVRRAVYEKLGGYQPGLVYALDWEMWVRIAARFGFWYDPDLLADYRIHQDAETARLLKAGSLLEDQCRAIGVFAASLPDPRREELLRRAHHECARQALRRVRRAIDAGTWDAAKKLLDQAVLADPCFSTRRRALGLKLRMKIARLHRFMGRPDGP